MTPWRPDAEPTRSEDAPTCRPGLARPFGATLLEDAVRFVVFSRHATRVILELYPDDRADACASVEMFRTGTRWHVEVLGVGAGARYAFRVEGPFDPVAGHRFVPGCPVVDPYARAWTGGDGRELRPVRGADPATRPDAPLPRGIVIDPRFDWGGVRRPRVPLEDTVIYEMHVRGFTRHPSANAAAAGRFAGVVEKIPYLRRLGITAVELLPIHEIDQNEVDREDPTTGERLTNFWGYSPLGYFAPRAGYAADADGERAVVEFKEMVKALHAAGIEVFLDVVFNHTGEGSLEGPTISFRGFDHAIYYALDGTGRPLDLAGCGNTLRCSHPVVADLIIDSLRYWVDAMHVDGFRFDLATILARDDDAILRESTSLLERIASDPLLADVKLIAEPWDAAGGYQVGRFAIGSKTAARWCEWNGRYRDDVRRFWRGDEGAVSSFATRLAGSSDLYAVAGRRATNGINFVTSHDGSPLRDVVSYATKHNVANGEFNRDGDAHEVRWNHGVEGETDDPDVAALRLRQAMNLLASMFLSRGVPMLLAGDERYRTQRGNNNAYCHDSPLSWIDWRDTDESATMLAFTRGLIALRRRFPALRAPTFYRGANAGRADIEWLAPRGPQRWDGSSLGCLIDGAPHGHESLLVLFHADIAPVTWALPAPPEGGEWSLLFDTGRSVAPPDPGDSLVPRLHAGRVESTEWEVAPHSAAAFVAVVDQSSEMNAGN